MGIGVTLHGFIETAGYGKQKESVEVYKLNKAAIKSLPCSDPDWPFITRSMFNVQPLRTSFDIHIPQYDNLLINFCASYKNMYLIEADWVRKFESLLSKLCWREACVYNEFCGQGLKWKVPDQHYGECFFGNPARPPQAWGLSAFSVRSEPVELSEAIDGEYKPVQRWQSERLP